MNPYLLPDFFPSFYPRFGCLASNFLHSGTAEMIVPKTREAICAWVEAFLCVLFLHLSPASGLDLVQL